MTIVRGFKAIRPKSELACKVAALPYDVMNSSEAREVVKGNPYSFLHVDKAEIDLEPAVDVYDERVYKKAKENLKNMINEKVYSQDNTENLYIYKLVMNGREQIGLVACTSIDDYMNNKIKKHEHTRADKEQDRIKHVDCCNANTGPIFLTYKAEQKIDDIINDWINSNNPVYDFTSEDEITHTIWSIENQEIVNKIHSKFKDVKELYIADGHHRAASAVKVGVKRREENTNYTGEEEFNFFLSVLFPHDQLFIMDYNRVVKDLNNFTTQEFLAKVKEKFQVDEYNGEGQFKPEEKHTFGMYVDNKWYVIKALDKFFDESDPVERLDVSILQKNILENILGIEDPRTDKRIDFVGGIRGLGELEKRVDDGMKVAFSMYPTTIEELMDIADASKMMPPKSTWFEPKLRSGLFVHELS